MYLYKIYIKYIHKFQLTEIASLWLQFLLHQERNRDSIDLFFIRGKQACDVQMLNSLCQ